MSFHSCSKPDVSPTLRIASLALAAILAATGCTPYASVAEQRPRFLPIPRPKILSAIQTAISNGLDEQKRNPREAIATYVDSLRASTAALQRNPKDPEARRDYNYALGRIFEIIRDAKLDPWTQPLRLSTAHGDLWLTHKPDPRPQWNPALYEFVPADQIHIGGSYVQKRTTVEGLGAPLVAIGRADAANHEKDFSLPRIYYGVTAVACFEGPQRCVISLEDPLARETTTLGAHSYPLAADFTAPLAVLLAKANPKSLELARLFQPQKYAETARLARLQPYDPKKTVVLVVHGLADTPATWTPMLNALLDDPIIRRNYQFWFYSYPSGYPYPYSASILRERLDAVEKRFPLQKPMVLIGHSMGGCISRLMITDSGNKIWLGLFGKLPNQMNLPASSRQMLEDALIFKHRPEVGRVIFISAPHRGSNLATWWIGRFASSLVRAPSTLVHLGLQMQRDLLAGDAGVLKLNRIPNSIDTLAPNNRFVKLIGTIPITPGIPYHSIMGDRGKGDTPNSSDGVVPYWSSHLDGAESELVVPSNHSAHQNPQAIQEVRRILDQHAGQRAFVIAD